MTLPIQPQSTAQPSQPLQPGQAEQDARSATLALVRADAGDAVLAAPQVMLLIETWLASLETEDLVDLMPSCLASGLWQGFSAVASAAAPGCQLVPLRYADGHGGWASAILVRNPDMPFLVDSIVMAMRRLQIGSRAVLNAVLTVQRAPDGSITDVSRARTGGDHLESLVLCLLQEELSPEREAALEDAVRMVAGDAAAVQRDSYAINSAMVAVASAVASQAGRSAQGNAADDARETAAFLEWAIDGGFEAFGYAFYRALPGTRELERDLGSRIGVLRDPAHPVYDRCLAGIPGEYDTLAARASALSVVKADTESTLHRDQHLDFIGVREIDAGGVIVGEHCFIGLFSRRASLTPLAQLPFVRGRIASVLALAGVRKEGFRAEKFLEILESLPRTEIFESDAAFLANVCSTVVALYKQPRPRVFARSDVYGRHLNLLVYLPRERYSEALATRLAHSVRALSGARDVRVQTLLADGPLARLHLVASQARLNMALDVNIEQPLLASIEGWSQVFDSLLDADVYVDVDVDVDINGDTDAAAGTDISAGAVVATSRRSMIRRLAAALPADYIARTSPQAAWRDLQDFLTLQATPRIRVHVEVAPQGAVEIRLLSVDAPPSLSRILPALQNAGVAVEREQTYEIPGPDAVRFFATCLSVDDHSATRLAQTTVAVAAQELFELLLNDQAEDGRMNALVTEAGLRTKEVQVIRAYASYWRQAGCRFSLRYIADCLKRQPQAVRILVQGFLARFDPALTQAERDAGTASLDALRHDLAAINHADTEDILKSLADLMLATLRTSYFQSKASGDTILFKFDSSTLALLPQPRPFRELFVFSRRFEGVHLRGGPVARGGLRWSDRMEDYRTEVLGLVKAQMVKNAVIVPAGAKGGFVCKLLPKDVSREALAAEGEAVYRLFIAGLLDLTDNRVGGSVAHPEETVCYDAPDPYLVVAADKGTATFSDIANDIAVARGFWLGDAFASGGSNGYDHKKLGITAKGAWEAVKRHFFELGHDLATTPISMTGVGDMSGDVFGNGLLLSHQVRLVAAFDHRHVFLDPTPDLEASFAERQRLFALPRSSWDDYDRSLISPGGGVFPRSARSIALTPQVRTALGTEVESATPEELLHLILLAPVDLFYNGGIGTYIKASTESHAAVKDRANDAIRADGAALRCRVVAEGGNLGATQAGRIEFALAGGRIFTDAIDNSAGVDCSDHEVNVKIWLDTEVAAGKIDVAERNRLLTSITDDIEALVLRDNTLQTHLLAREEQAQADADSRAGYAALISALEAGQVISRSLEQLPDAAELAQRGLTAPELAVVIAHVKNRYKRLLAELPLTQFDWAPAVLAPYFPAPLVASRDPLAHPLANAILATVVANEAINRCGPLMIVSLAARHAVTETDVLLAWARGWATLHFGELFATLDAHALSVTPVVSRDLDARTRALQAAVTSGVLAMPAPLAASATSAASTTGATSATSATSAIGATSAATAAADATPEASQASAGALPAPIRTAHSPHAAPAGLAELERLFGQDGAMHAQAGWLAAAAGLDQGTAGAAAVAAGADDVVLAAASRRVDAVETIADFLFAALSVARPPSMPLRSLLDIGLAVRRRTGIGLLEQRLMHADAAPAQQALRGHALQALRRAQQQLLQRALADIAGLPSADPQVDSRLAHLLAPLGSFAPAATHDGAGLDAAILAAWTLSDAILSLLAGGPQALAA